MSFIIIKRNHFEEALSEMPYEWTDITQTLPGTKEVVYQLITDMPNKVIRLYSSIDIRTHQTRDIGADAIRVILFNPTTNKPISKSRKILRIDGATTVYQRIQKQITKLLDEPTPAHSFTPPPDSDMDYVKAVLSFNKRIGFAESMLEQLNDRGSLSPLQMSYIIGDINPKGFPTFEKTAKQRDPEFYRKWKESRNEPALTTPDRVEDLALQILSRRSNDFVEALELPESVVDSPPDARPLAQTIRDRQRAANPSNPLPTRDIGEFADMPAHVFDPDNEAFPPMEEAVDFDHLIPTDDYQQYFQYPFGHFNPVQSKVLPFADQDVNMVIGANTSAGKTICAEFFIDDTLEAGKKVIYLSPLKSLTQEKYSDWSSRFSDKKIEILTGDYTLSEKSKRKLRKANIIVMTSEMMDSRTRRMHMENNYWLHEVGLVIVDEAHILATGRGHAVEAGIMRFTKINKNARILLLSATMPNVADLGQWLSNLNQKPTEVIESSWRPVNLDIAFEPYEVKYFSGNSGRMNYMATQQNKINLAVSIAREKMDEKYLIFVHDKTTGRKIVQALNAPNSQFHFRGEELDCGNPAVFHNADLNMEQRLEIEKGFENRNFAEDIFDGTRVLVSTSTLAWGRNLPARNVIVVGVHRGMSEVDEYDIIQMSGRAGRYGIDDKGFVRILLPHDDPFTWKDKIEHPRNITSVLNGPGVLEFHAISEIDTGAIGSSDDLLLWYARSFANQQELMERHKANEIFQTLTDMEMIDISNYPRVNVTGLGKVCSWLYFSPYDVRKWYENMDEIIRTDAYRQNKDLAMAYAIANVPTFDFTYVPKDVQDENEILNRDLRNLSITHYNHGCSAYLIGVLAALQGRNEKEMPASARTARRTITWDIRRINQALSLIDSKFAEWGLEKDWKILPIRLKYGVPDEMINLVFIPGVGGVRAKKMYDKGLRTAEQVASAKGRKKLNLIFAPKTAKKIQIAARELVENTDS